MIQNPLKNEYLISIVLGGVLCFVIMFVFLSILPGLLLVIIRQILLNLNTTGLLAFSGEITNAISLLMLGTIYLPSGFCGGLYVGTKIKDKLKVSLVFPALIGFTALLILRFSLGHVDLLRMDFSQEILFPLLGNIVGAYLGGYTMNWEPKNMEEPSKTIETSASEEPSSKEELPEKKESTKKEPDSSEVKS